MVDVINLHTCKDWGRPGDILVDRKTKWGNPYTMHNESQRDIVCDKYEIWINEKLELKIFDLNDLKSAKRLGCHCAPKRCHADYLKKLLERSDKQQTLRLYTHKS